MEENGSSTRIVLDADANSLAFNKDHSCIAVAGRSRKFLCFDLSKRNSRVFLSLLVLKVFSIDHDGFAEVHNMRQQQGNSKNLNLSYSSNAIAWSHLETNILATSATNGEP